MTRIGFGIIKQRFVAMNNLAMYKKLLADAKQDGVLSAKELAAETRLLEEGGLASVGAINKQYATSFPNRNPATAQ